VRQAPKRPAAKPKGTKKAALADKEDSTGLDAEMSSDGGVGPSNGIHTASAGKKKTASEKYTKV
jgi:hypothetical protein